MNELVGVSLKSSQQGAGQNCQKDHTRDRVCQRPVGLRTFVLAGLRSGIHLASVWPV
jgi:hypothetical protein